MFLYFRNNFWLCTLAHVHNVSTWEAKWSRKIIMSRGLAWASQQDTVSNDNTRWKKATKNTPFYFINTHNGYFVYTDLNYFLSVIPFLAAIDSGVMELSSDITLQLPSKDQEKFCYDVSSCHSSFPEAMKVWNKLYQVIFFNFNYNL